MWLRQNKGIVRVQIFQVVGWNLSHLDKTIFCNRPVLTVTWLSQNSFVWPGLRHCQLSIRHNTVAPYQATNLVLFHWIKAIVFQLKNVFWYVFLKQFWYSNWLKIKAIEIMITPKYCFLEYLKLLQWLFKTFFEFWLGVRKGSLQLRYEIFHETQIFAYVLRLTLYHLAVIQLVFNFFSQIINFCWMVFLEKGNILASIFLVEES